MKKTIRHTKRKNSSSRTSKRISHPIKNLKILSSLLKRPKKPIKWPSSDNKTNIRFGNNPTSIKIRNNRNSIKIANIKFVRITSIKKKERIRKYSIFSQELLIYQHFQQWRLATVSSITVPRGSLSSKWVKIILWRLKIKIQCAMILLLEFLRYLRMSSLITYFLFSQPMNFLMLGVCASSGSIMWNRHGILRLNARCISNCWLASSAKT